MIAYARAVPVPVPVDAVTLDPDPVAIEAAITPRTRAVVVNTPHNPTGRIYTDAVLRAIADVLSAASARHGRPIFLLSDEAYNRIVFDGRAFVSPTTLYPHAIMLYSHGKTLLAPGQWLGYLVLAPSMPDREAIRAAILLAQFAGGGYGVPDALMQHAVSELEPLCVDLARLERRRDRIVDELRASGYAVERPEATFYVLLRSPLPDDERFAAVLADRDVYVLPGRVIRLPGFVRISLTATDATVERAIPRFREAPEACRDLAEAPGTRADAAGAPAEAGGRRP